MVRRTYQNLWLPSSGCFAAASETYQASPDTASFDVDADVPPTTVTGRNPAAEAGSRSA
jgi:hypothetical protein